MLKHPWFDLLLHTDDELSLLLNSVITERVTLHEWPLSCVQRIQTADGQRWIYKTQTGPSVEAQFYEQAQLDLLIPARTIYQQDGHVTMLLEYIDAPRLTDLNPSAETVVQIGRDVLQEIAAIQGDIPVLFDVSRPDKWQQMVTETLDHLQMLVIGGQFQQVTLNALETLRQSVLSDDVLYASQYDIGLVHGDLTGENLFLLTNNLYKVIDWTRPFLGPTAIDLAMLLESLGHDPLVQVDPSIVVMVDILRIQWLAQCAAQWFPAGMATYDAQIARLIGRLTDF
jgi:thiamine kinase-like enzyme